ncbi:MAG TPA: hypothetical protein VIV83_13235, partial [Gemmatimonadales bacterium]
YDDRSVAVVNGERTALQRARLETRVLGLDGSVSFSRDTMLDLPADSVTRVLVLPEPTAAGAYFVDLRLKGADGRSLSTNFYWLSSRTDVLADTSTWYMTPVKSYADLTGLRDMPAAQVKTTATFTARGGRGEARVTVSNPGRSVAFFLRLQVIGKGGQEVLPVLWEDNYVSLLPGETRVLTAGYAVRDLGGARPQVVVSGYNVARMVAR